MRNLELRAFITLGEGYTMTPPPSPMETEEPHAVTLISILLVILGLLSIGATVHIHRRINETVVDIVEVEEALSLKRTVVHWTGTMTAPYYAMLLIGIGANLAAPFFV